MGEKSPITEKFDTYAEKNQITEKNRLLKKDQITEFVD